MVELADANHSWRHARSGSLESRPLGRRVQLALLVALLLALPVATIAWFADGLLERRDVDRYDSTLSATVEAAFGGLRSMEADAAAGARRTASSPPVQRAMAAGDRNALARLVADAPGTSIWVKGRRLAGPAIGARDLVRSVAVVGRGHTIGKVSVAIRLDDSLLRQLGSQPGSGGARLLVVGGHRILAGGPPTGALDLPPGAARGVQVGDMPFRAVGRAVPGSGFELVALLPQSIVDHATQTTRKNVVVGSLATLLALVVLVDLLYPLVDARRRKRRLAEERERLELVAETLGARHDREALLPIVLATMVDAAGASGGLLVDGTREAARTGEIGTPGEPMLIPLSEGTGKEVLLILSAPPGGFTDEQRRRANVLAPQASAALENARLHALAQHEAVTDSLTGLANRRWFTNELEAELRRSARYGRPVAIVLLDLDDFKAINDRYGHGAGDEALVALAEVLRKVTRDVDLPARIGGEEFAVLAPESDEEGASILAERLRASIEEVRLAAGGGILSLTASFGVAATPPDVSVEVLMHAADRALYEAKRRGKNRTVRATSLDSEVNGS